MAKHILVDVETYGPVPGIHDMVSFAAICYETKQEFYRELEWSYINIVDEAKAVADLGLKGNPEDPEKVMKDFEKWLLVQIDTINEKLIFVSDSTSFDHAFITYYSWKYLGYSIFGHSSISLNQVYKGMKKDMRVNIGGLRPKGMKDHNALNDCRSNVVVLDKLIERGLKFKKRSKC